MSRPARTSAVLGLSSLAAGVLAYVLFALLTRQLGATDAAPVSILWTYWGLSAAAITFPVQHWIARTVAAEHGFAAARHAVPGQLVVVAVASLVAGLVAWLLRDPLFARDGLAFPALVSLMTVGAFVMGLSRGILTAHHRFTTLAVTLVVEQLTRIALIAALALAGVSGSEPYGLAIVAGSFVVLAVPSAFRMPSGDGDGDAADRSARSGLQALASSASAQLLSQLVLTGAPVVLAVRGGAPDRVTALFVALAVFRAPMIMAQSQVAPLTGQWTVLVAEGRTPQLRRIRLLLAGLAGPLAVAAAGVGAVLGDPVIRLVFGEIHVTPEVCAVVAAGSTVAVANLGATVLAIAHGRPGFALRAWLVGCLVGPWALLLDARPELATAAAFTATEVVAFVVLLLSVRTTKGSPETGP